MKTKKYRNKMRRNIKKHNNTKCFSIGIYTEKGIQLNESICLSLKRPFQAERIMKEFLVESMFILMNSYNIVESEGFYLYDYKFNHNIENNLELIFECINPIFKSEEDFLFYLETIEKDYQTVNDMNNLKRNNQNENETK